MLLVFTDPAAVGLYFMGALLLLEKSQRVLPALAVDPVAPWQYVCSKTLDLSLARTLVGAALCLSGPGKLLAARILTLLPGAFFFSLAGMTAAFYSGSLNKFLLLSTGRRILYPWR